MDMKYSATMSIFMEYVQSARSRNIQIQSNNKKEGTMTYVCSVCGYNYDEKAENKEFDKLPHDWNCPICNAPKTAFQKSS